MSKPRQHLAAVALVVPDYDEAKTYYSQVLGFDVIEDVAIGEGKRWLVVAPPGSRTHLVLAKASNPAQESRIGDQTGGRVFLFLYTDDFWRDYSEMQQKGVNFVRTPKEEPYGTVAVFEDLYGNLWDLIGN